MHLKKACLPALIIFFTWIIPCAGYQVGVVATDTTKLDLTSKAFMISAHRGDWHRYSENSLESIRSCVDGGVNFIEIDIQVSKDNVPVLMHDASLDRTTTGKGLVADFTLAELKQLTLKSGQLGPLPYSIPTLEEVLLAFQGEEVFFNLDKVGSDKKKLVLVLEVLERAASLHKGVFWVKHDTTVNRELFGKYLEKVNLVPFVTDGDIDQPGLLEQLESSALQINPAFIYLCVGELDDMALRVIDFAKKRNIPLGCAPTWSHMSFGLSDRVSLEQDGYGWKELYKLGFTFFETNYPFEMKRVLEEQAR